MKTNWDIVEYPARKVNYELHLYVPELVEHEDGELVLSVVTKYC